MSKVRASIGVAGIVAGVLAIILPQWVLSRLGSRPSRLLPIVFFWTTTRLFGVKFRVTGRPADTRPALFVANHISWLDIFVLGALHQGAFVARGDMEGWPVFGWLSTLRRTIFIDRERRTKSSQQLNKLEEKLYTEDSLLLFPEGTSTDGIRVLPFKSSLFAVAERWQGSEPLTVQPISLAYTHINNMPLARHYRPYIGWYGDMELTPHLWELLQLGRLTASIHYHEPITLEHAGDRKALSATCRESIAAQVERLNRGIGDAQPS